MLNNLPECMDGECYLTYSRTALVSSHLDVYLKSDFIKALVSIPGNETKSVMKQLILLNNTDLAEVFGGLAAMRRQVQRQI